jgi:hypothetical protein
LLLVDLMIDLDRIFKTMIAVLAVLALRIITYQLLKLVHLTWMLIIKWQEIHLLAKMLEGKVKMIGKEFLTSNLLYYTHKRREHFKPHLLLEYPRMVILIIKRAKYLISLLDLVRYYYLYYWFKLIIHLILDLNID